jgi:hypothetical protein
MPYHASNCYPEEIYATGSYNTSVEPARRLSENTDKQIKE